MVVAVAAIDVLVHQNLLQSVVTKAADVAVVVATKAADVAVAVALTLDVVALAAVQKAVDSPFAVIEEHFVAVVPAAAPEVFSGVLS